MSPLSHKTPRISRGKFFPGAFGGTIFDNLRLLAYELVELFEIIFNESLLSTRISRVRAIL